MTCSINSISVRVKKRDNQKWTKQRQWEYWALKTQDKDKHNTEN